MGGFGLDVYFGGSGGCEHRQLDLDDDAGSKRGPAPPARPQLLPRQAHLQLNR